MSTLNYSGLKMALVILTILIGFAFAAPNVLSPELRAHLPSWLKPMELGLDLRGGSYLLLEVDTSAVRKEQLSDLTESVRTALRDKKLGYRNLRATEDAVYVTLNDAADAGPVRSAIVAVQPQMLVETADEGRVRISVPENILRDREVSAVNQSLEIVRRRVDEFGTSEPNIQRQGRERIIVELPGVGDPERIKALIGQTAKLTFHLVEQGASPMSRDLPPGTMLLDDSNDPNSKFVVKRRVEVSGERLVDAQAGYQDGRPIVNFRFDTAGGMAFGRTTSAAVNQSLAIVLDNKVISAPRIKSPIVGGAGFIEGIGGVEEAQDLALLLRAGALPAPLNILEERTVGPSLGADSIRDGKNASIVGGILVAGFMFISYFLFGLLAVLAMAVNVILLLGVLSLFGGVLTLPGVAGIVLTLGMSVDSNVLIYERMREEWAAGRTLMNTLASGFNGAFAAVIDSNITQFIAGILLFFLGSGPVRGFAVTITIGVFTSLFATTMVTRMLVIMWLRSGKRQTLPI